MQDSAPPIPPVNGLGLLAKLFRRVSLLVAMLALGYAVLIRGANVPLFATLGLSFLAAGKFIVPPPAKGTPKQRITMLCAWALSCLSVAVLLEIGVRFTIPLDIHLVSGVIEPHPDCLHAPTPGAKGVGRFIDDSGRTAVFPVRISSQGLRDREYGPKADGEFRIVMIGDSFTWGTGLHLEETIPKVLEDLLKRETAYTRISVVNAGCGGYGPWQAHALLKERGFPLEPDLVILQLLPTNDIGDTLIRAGRSLRAYKRSHTYHKTCLLHYDDWKFRFDRWLRIHSRLYLSCLVATDWRTSIGASLNRIRVFHNPDSPAVPESEPRPWHLEVLLRESYPVLDEGWGLLFDDVARIRDDCARRGVGFAAYTIPHQATLKDGDWERITEAGVGRQPYERFKGTRLVEEFFGREGVPYLPLLDRMLEYRRTRKLFYALDGHFTSDGAEVVAQRLADFVSKKYLLDIKSSQTDSPL